MSIESFIALRYDEERVDYKNVLAPHGSELFGGASGAMLESEPRNIVRLLGLLSADRQAVATAKFYLADWQRAGVVTADEYPAFYFLRDTYAPAPGETEPTVVQGFFAHVRGHDALRVLDNGAPPRAEDAPITALYEDAKGRIARTLRAETAERDADVRVAFDEGVSELFVIDDETTCARISEVMSDTALLVVDGVGAYASRPAGFPFVAFLISTDDPRAQARPVHRVFGAGEFDRAAFLGAADAHFVAEAVPHGADIDEVLGQSDTAFVLLEHDGHTRFLLGDADAQTVGLFMDALRARPTFERTEAEAAASTPGAAGLLLASPATNAASLMGNAAPRLHAGAAAFGPRVSNGFVVAPTVRAEAA